MRQFTVKQLQHKGGLADNNHWVVIWSGVAENMSDAKQKAVEEIIIKTLVVEVDYNHTFTEVNLDIAS